MSYTPNASQLTEPVESRAVQTAALEFRTIKSKLTRTLRFPASDTAGSQAELPAANARAGRLLVFDPVTGQPVAGPLTHELASVAVSVMLNAATEAATSATNAAASATAAINAAGLAQATNPTPPIVLNAARISANFGIPPTHRGHSVGPIAIDLGVTVAVDVGAVWQIS